MSILYCPGCQGILGRDCFDTDQCQEIAASIAAHEQEFDESYFGPLMVFFDNDMHMEADSNEQHDG